MKSRLMRALGMLAVTGVLLLFGFVWFLKATMDEQNTVVDSQGHKLTIDLPGSVSSPVEWMRNDWVSVGNEVAAEVYNSVTPAYRACTDQDLKKDIDSTQCSIVLSDRCSPQVRFIRFVARSGDTDSGVTMANVLFKVRDHSGTDYLRSTCNGASPEPWTKPVPDQQNAPPEQTDLPPTPTVIDEQQRLLKPRAAYVDTRDFRPSDIQAMCQKVPNVPDISVALDGSDPDEISLHDCGGGGVFVIVSEKRRDTVCSIDFTLSNADDFKITKGSSKALIATTALPGSSGEVYPWTVELTKKNGSFSAISADGLNPKVQCDNL